MQQIIICEDDPIQLADLESYTRKSIEDEIEIFTFTCGKELLSKLPTFSRSCIFLLDIMLKDENGIEIAKQINELQAKASIIFITAYLDLVTDIFDTRHCYFVLKSDIDIRLERALQKAMDQQNQNKTQISLQEGAEKIILHTEDIIYIERELRVTYIHTSTEVKKISLNLERISKHLPSYFQRCHNSYIINFKMVVKIRNNELIMVNDIYIPISRPYQRNVKKKFEAYILELV